MQQQYIFILGMHRSGTSAVAKFVELLGAQLGQHLMPPTVDNPKGYFENQRVVDLNSEILDRLGFCWDSTLELPQNWWGQPEIQALKENARHLLQQEFGNVPVSAIKDPRLCRLLPFWLKLCAEEGYAVKVIIVLRPPMEIAGSLKARDDFPEEKSLLLWAEHFLEAEYYTRSLPRVFVTYDEMFQSSEAVSKKIASALSITWPQTYKAIAPQMIEFLDISLRHHQQTASINKSWLGHFAGRLEPLTHHPDSEQLDILHWELSERLKNAAELSWFVHADAVKGAHIYRDHLTKMHEKNLEIGSLNERITEYDVQVMNLNHEVNALNHQINALNDQANTLIHHNNVIARDIEAIRNSTSWKITAPLRKTMVLLRSWRRFKRWTTYKSAYALLRERGLRAFWKLLIRELFHEKGALSDQENYRDWIKRYELLTLEQRKQMNVQLQQMATKPLISILMPVYNIEEKWLRAAVQSVHQQIYPHWELCIADDASSKPHIKPLLMELVKQDPRIKVIYREKNAHISEASNSALTLASGAFVALMDHDDVIAPDALFRVAEEINKHPGVMLLYSDEDKIDTDNNRYAPYFKSDWNTDLFYAHNMFSHLGVYRRTLIEKVGGFRKGFEGSQDYDLALRCLEQIEENQIRHIRRVLYHWRSVPGSTSIAIGEKNYAAQAAYRALREHFFRRYPKLKIDLAPTFIPGSLRLVWPVPEKLPLVSLIIPTRNGLDFLSVCVASILKKTRYVNYEILIVDNQSDDPKTLAYFDKIQQQDARVRVVKYDQPFNYSAINNFAVEQTKGDIIGLINNDIEAMNGVDDERCWLTEMVSHVARPEVGAVGAKLYYPNGRVQHGGVLTGLGVLDGAVAGHLFVNLTKDDAGYFARAIVTQQLSAVTAACMLVRREVFEEVGRLDAENLPVAFNDVDFCLKIRKAGYKIIWTPFAELIHHESISRGKEDTPEKKVRAEKEIRYMREKWGDFLLNDPYYNPNLDYIRGNFALAFPPRTDV